eukprot:TRINITY_DN11693_c0_g1_i1.p1 TRINITY_DN11693_c0_g1~~TRINITY_DN11693_c0_g1_i1.p1  ORF type:complete len:329 (+),score=89.53 TRINITY_DN11693_c0_g1_i1:80-1066(+)
MCIRDRQSTWLRRKITQEGYHVRIYNALKTDDPAAKTILKEVDLEVIERVVDLLKTVILGYPKVEEEIAELIKTDLSKLEDRRDLTFVNNYLILLINAEVTVPTCLHPYDPNTKKCITEGRKLSQITNVKAQSAETFSTTIFSESQKTIFMNTMKQFTTSTGLYRKIQNAQWQNIVTVKEEGQNVLEDLKKMSKKGPFILIVEGNNAGKHCVLGAFSSQAMIDIPPLSEGSLDIPLADDCFLFYYEDGFQYHFPIPPHQNQNYFARLHLSASYSDSNGLSFYHNACERIFLSFSSLPSYIAVSYTHLRAHETDSYLVCRLLLEKKKNV